MNNKSFQTKRQPKKGFRLLQAKTRKKRKQRVSAAAAGGDFAVEEPNLGVARALVVILILHVAAIVAIVVHNSGKKGEVAVTDTPVTTPEPKPAVAAATTSTTKPKIRKDDRWEWVGAGDTYERIARRNNVNVDELRRLNGNVALRSGIPLKLPAEIVEPARYVAPELANETPMMAEVLPPIVEVAPNALEYEVVEPPEPIVAVVPDPFPVAETHTPEPVAEPLAEVRRVTQPVVEATPAPRPAPAPVVETPRPAAPAMKTYTIRRKDTLWAIANKNGISVDALMKANPGIKPTKLGLGSKINIPSR